MAARSSRQSPASTGKRRRDASEGSTPAKAGRKRLEDVQTTLEQAELYRILTATMPVDALTADWSMGRSKGSNRPIEEKHVNALYTIFQRGDMKRASYPLAVLSTQTEDLPAFDNWLVNRRPVELLDGQHRVAALKRLVSKTGADEQELHWPCHFYDRDALPPELNRALRMNRRDPTMADSHGDIWVQLSTVASERPGIFHGTVDEMKEQMRDALRLSSDTGFPLTRLVIIWRNERWRQMTTRWCETTVGRATFQTTTWEWMICHRIDDFWFMAFGQVLGTLAQLPGDAAKLVSSEDWKKMSASLGAERTQEQVQELFYPGQSGKPLNAASKRNRKLLQSFNDGEYWDIYGGGNGRVLFQVLDQVVSWVNRKRTGVNRGSTKPQLRLDLEPVLDYYTPTRLRQAEKRIKIFHSSATPQLPLESASVLLQQEVLEFVLEHLAAFNAPKMRDYLTDGDPDSDLYAARFREDTWAGVLKIVRWHAASLTDALCNYDAGLSAVREKLHSKLQSSVFRSAFAAWLSEQCGGEPDSEDMQSGDGARGSGGPHAKDDGLTVAAAVAAKSRGVDRPAVDPKPGTSPAAKEAAKPDATRDAPVPPADGARCLAEGRSPDRDGRRQALTDKAEGNGTKAPARKKQGEPVLDPTREVQRQEHYTATPPRRAEKSGWVEPARVRTKLSSKPRRTLPGVSGTVTPARVLAKCTKAPLAHM
ncbi:hypothetical protein PLIIFM63780_002173 [Purpureocillium lilacinum]|nr:hypothetical protein PLIIFM63780_002173 [Purpureocillium lilacinum]